MVGIMWSKGITSLLLLEVQICARILQNNLAFLKKMGIVFVSWANYITPGQNKQILGVQEYGNTRISRPQRQLDSQELSHAQVPRITGSQRQLVSEEFSHNQDHMKERLQSDIARTSSISDNQLAGRKHKKISNRNQGYLASTGPNTSPVAHSGYTITPEKQDSYLKSLLMMMIEDFNKGIKKLT